MRSARREGCLKLSGGNQAFVEERATKRLDGGGQIIDHRIIRADADEKRSILDFLDARKSHQLIKALCESHVSADGRKDLLQQVRQPIPARMRRVTVQGRNVWLLESDNSAGACHSYCLLKKLLWLARRAREETYVR